jgi:hypothetical protein
VPPQWCSVSGPARGGAERFPGTGLHWLLGLTRLAVGDTTEARREFERELSSEGTGIYAAEFVMNAQDGLGFVGLVEGDPSGAYEMFARALEAFPGHARSLVGLASACHQAGLEGERNAAIGQALQAIGELRSGHRAAEAAMATALAQAAADRRGEAAGTLSDLLSAAPPGFAGWTVPVEPLLAVARTEASFQPVLATLAGRAR